MPKLFRFFLLLVVFSVPLFWLWAQWGQNTYQQLMGATIVPLARKMGEKSLNLFLIKGHYLNVVPFAALILASPALGWKKRATALVFGLAVLFCWHLVFSLVLNHFQTLWDHDRRFYRLFVPATSLNSAMPVVLWFIVAWRGVKDLLGEIFVRPEADRSTAKSA